MRRKAAISKLKEQIATTKKNLHGAMAGQVSDQDPAKDRMVRMGAHHQDLQEKQGELRQLCEIEALSKEGSLEEGLSNLQKMGFSPESDAPKMQAKRELDRAQDALLAQNVRNEQARLAGFRIENLPSLQRLKKAKITARGKYVKLVDAEASRKIERARKLRAI